VFNPDTGAITPAFHIVFDDWFATVASDSLPDFGSPDWQRLFGDFTFQFPFDDDDLTDIEDLGHASCPTMTLLPAQLTLPLRLFRFLFWLRPRAHDQRKTPYPHELFRR
jgi:hypothetical protein